MRPLIVLSARWVALTTAAVLALGLAGGLVRLLPWLVAPGVPLRIAAPFARLLAGGAIEAAVLLGLPIGAAIAAAIFVERGEARALAALGAGPVRLLAGVGAAGLVLMAMFAAASATAEPEPAGRLAARLIIGGRHACTDGARRVDVPFVGFTWICFPGGPKLTGPIPRAGSRMWFSASEISPGDDLRTAELDDVHVSGKLATRSFHLHASKMNLVGLAGYGTGRNFRGPMRALLVSGSALLAALVAAAGVLRGNMARPIAVAAASGAGACAMLAVVQVLDRHGVSPLLYGAVPAAGTVALAAALSVVRRVSARRVA